MTNSEVAGGINGLSLEQKLYFNNWAGASFLSRKGSSLSTPDKSEVSTLYSEYDAKSSTDQGIIRGLVDDGGDDDDVFTDTPC